MRILILENCEGGAGLVGETIVARGGECVMLDPHMGGRLPMGIDGFDGAIVLGGVQFAGDDEKNPAFPPILELLRAFHGASKPVLGICLGGQLIARAFGGSVFKHRELEFGFHPLTITEEGFADPLLRDLDGTQWIFQWHEDTFELPEGAELLMRGEDCTNQAFRMGSTTYGFQCHFEVNEEMIRLWQSLDGDVLSRDLGERCGPALEGLEKDVKERLPKASGFARTITGRWLDLFAP